MRWLKKLIVAVLLAAANTANAGNGDLIVDGKLDVGGPLTANRHTTHTQWYNVATPQAGPSGYVKLVTPINQFEGNMFVLKIHGYRFIQSRPIEISCAGYAYTAAGLIKSSCHTEGTDDPVGIGVENDNVIVTVGAGTTGNWYYDHFTVEYVGWNAKRGEDFQWQFVQNTVPPTYNTNNVFIDDASGTISTTGSIGIGMTAPTHKLSVYDSSTNGFLIDAASIPVQRFAVAGTNKWGFLVNNAATNAFGIYDYTRGDYSLVMMPNGNVVIGTALNVNGQVTSNGVVLTSDVKYKKNLLPINTALDKVLNLTGLTYEWRTHEYKEKNFPNGRHYGVIAQEIERVLPEVVNTAADGTKAVAYTEIIPVLIEAIKEQQKRIELLEKKLTEQH
ncbi:MAG: tail fiber domain-containing protein [Desulfuromonadales bacterium]|nr:tail fiber domain-containing protein [Desulfuromonadales bacterium]